MSLAVRIFALSIVLVGAAAAFVSSTSTKNLASHQSATAGNPVPVCIPGLPTCTSAAATQ